MILPLHLLWGLQMPLKEKAIVVTAFNLRLPVIGLSIGRAYFTQRLCNHSTDLGLGSALAIILAQVELSYAIVSNTFSVLRAFTMSFNSSFGLGFVANTVPENYALYQAKNQRSSRGSAKNRSRSCGQPRDRALIPRENTLIDPHDFGTQSDFGHTYTEVSASNDIKKNKTDHIKSRENEDFVILRKTEYFVRHSDVDNEMPVSPESSASALEI